MELPKNFKPVSKYYEVKELLEKHSECKYYVTFGERDSGKTYALERYMKYKEAVNK